VQQHQQAPSSKDQVWLGPTLNKRTRELQPKNLYVDTEFCGSRSDSVTTEAHNKQGTDCTYTLLGLTVINNKSIVSLCTLNKHRPTVLHPHHNLDRVRQLPLFALTVYVDLIALQITILGC
jgi:hypothetical protein